MSKDYLKKLFPLNRIIVAETMGLLCMLTGSYYILAVILYELAKVLQLIYLVGRIFVIAEFAAKIYCFCGISIGCCQYLIRNGYARTERININELHKLLENKLYRIIIIAVAVVICFQLVFRKENSPEARQNAEEAVQIDDAVHDETVSHKKQEVTESEPRETMESEPETDGDAESELVMRQNQLDLYEDIKGFWKGSDVQYTFSRVNDQYCFFDSNSLGDVMTNGNFYIAYYNVDAYEKTDNIVKAVISDRDGRTYDVELYLDADNGRLLNIKSQADKEWTVLTDNTFFSYQELLEAGEYKALWMQRQYYDFRTDGVNPYNEWISIEKNDEFCFLDVTEQYEGDEMIVCYTSDFQSNSYYVLGIRDGYVQPLYSLISFLGLECYDAENKILWTFYYGGTAGGSCYGRMLYDEEHDGWTQEESDETSINCVRLSLEKIW